MRYITSILLFFLSLILYGSEDVSRTTPEKESYSVYLIEDNGILYYETQEEVHGILPFIVERMRENTGINFEIHQVSREELRDAVYAGTPDIIMGIEDRPLNRSVYTYLDTSIDLNGAIITREDTPSLDSGLDLEGRDVAFVERNSIRNKAILKYGENMNVHTFSTDREALTSLRSGESDYFIEDLTEALEIIAKNLKSDIKINYLSSSLKTSYYIGIKSGHSDLTEALTSTIEGLDINKDLIYDHTLEYMRDSLSFFKRISDYIEKTDSIGVLLPEGMDTAPYYYIDENGVEEGYLVRYFRDVEKILGIDVAFIRKETAEDVNIDPFILSVNGIIEREGDYLTTESYYEGHPVLFNKKSRPFFYSPFNFNRHTFAVADDSIMMEYLLLKGTPMENLVIFPTQEEALKAVSSGRVDFFIEDIKWTEYLMQKNRITNLKAAEILPDRIALQFGISRDDSVLHLILSSFEKKLAFEGVNRKRELFLKDITVSGDYKLTAITTTASLIFILLLYIQLRRRSRNYSKLQKITISLVDTLENANSYKDEDTGHHVKRINRYSVLLAEELRIRWKLSSRFIEDIALYASLHDIGKIGIPDSILKKPGRLTPGEFQKMKEHTIIGFEMIKDLEVSPVASNIVKYHHEKWQGGGYPHGLMGDAIPKEARIVALADVYDALRQRRVYKDPFSHEKSLEIILSQRGKHFDPDVVDAFHTLHREFDNIFMNN